MSEQYPLLYDDVSEEERFSPRFHRRLLMSRARAKNHVNGAAAIITRWPEHWTTFLNCWWIGIGMIALTTFIIYNFLFSYAMLQPTYKIHPKHEASQHTNIKPTKLLPKPSSSYQVYMHVFVNNQQEIDLNNYMPYIEIIKNKYKKFKYELIIVANDTNDETKSLSDKENNEIALNMLWATDYNNKKNSSNNNLNIKYVTLSQYLYDTPLKKYWRSLPNQFIKFLVRAVSVWEKGGIAFDPIVLTPLSPYPIYFDKVNNILQKYQIKKEKSKSKKFKPNNSYKKELFSYKSKPNNIRDIINILENEDAINKSYQEPLAVAESELNLTFTSKRNVDSVSDAKTKDALKYENTTPITTERNEKTSINSIMNYENNIAKGTTKQQHIDNSRNERLFPMFLEYLFHSKPSKSYNVTTIKPKAYNENNRLKDVYKRNENKSIMREFWSEIKNESAYKPMIVSAKGIFDKSDNLTKIADKIENEVENLFEVTIDLKGNIIATDMPCHAFIGGLFSNAIHHDESESATDFIIKELSIFCKGLLASCVGIDVILL